MLHKILVITVGNFFLWKQSSSVFLLYTSSNVTLETFCGQTFCFMHSFGLIVFSLSRQYSHWLEWEFCLPEYMFGHFDCSLTSLVNHCMQVLCILLRSKKYLSQLLFLSNCKCRVTPVKSTELHWFQWSYSDVHQSGLCRVYFYDLEEKMCRNEPFWKDAWFIFLLDVCK